MMSWGMIIYHVVIVSLLSNIGKLFPVLFYRDRKLSERLALSIGMFTRGEVGAGIIFIALGYNLGGPALVISVLTLVLNLILTSIFVLWVKTWRYEAITADIYFVRRVFYTNNKAFLSVIDFKDNRKVRVL